jgi:hypothetical protein
MTLRDQSKRQGDFYVPRYEIKIAGANLPQNVVRDVLQVTYSDNIGTPRNGNSNMLDRKRTNRWQTIRCTSFSIPRATVSRSPWDMKRI